jgi:Fe-S-cluster containining protein
MNSPTNTSLRDNIIQIGHLLAQTTNVGQTGDATDVDALIDFLAAQVTQTYPAIPCKAGCSQCCIDSGLPRTTAAEWAVIYVYLKTQMPAEALADVLARNERLHRTQIPALLQEQTRIQNPLSATPMQPIGCLECPFLRDHVCSIYPVRPAICRGFGNFTLRAPEREPSIFACQMAADTLLADLQARQIVGLELPAWNKFIERVYDLNQAFGGVAATLPLWLFSHQTPEGQLEDTWEPAPDFEALAHLQA